LLTLKPDAHRRLNLATSEEPVRFVVCQGCGFIYQTPRFVVDELKAIYAEEYRSQTIKDNGVPLDAYLDFARTKSRREFDWITSRLPQGTRGAVLEIGCATGQLLRVFKDVGWDPYGIEPTLSFAHYGEKTHGLPILSSLFEETQLDRQFDLIILSQVLEHADDPHGMLKRARSLLAEGGRIYLSVPNYESYLPIRPARELFISTHLYVFSPVSTANLAAQCGLSVEDQGTITRYLCAILRPLQRVAALLQRENPDSVRRRVRKLTRRYFVVHDSRYLLAEWIKGRLAAVLGKEKGEQTIEALRHLKHRFTRFR
jgi:2-polyprenyl-3-methyl-5-hydroxy-6-metoxy-1,4-benzoquinol methylase